ncbi:maleylpyruvate isomerase family mycothiol-dependent enzyme [Streptomyces sp. HNM0574]|uniref:maleylpyruvate isomerase family mycothiol-dependent enzyme n=1 Tax=Streptomyces sp. HNM0574 TaxID=2714954 RepID=UPI00146E4B54|nr:maleylpyruvate isomerase family mycothiol-dependent enzyme [Streptomyces sp. HNM0574]NLU67516.1 maleylpyruvate isomerase family mycothiol-dependent enzyme [Streptomyces sp. HNM0574]
MTSPAHDAALVRESTDRLLTVVAGLDDAAVAGPSLLPGWTRGHVITHLARNADALVRVLAGRPMYDSAESRDADIDKGAGRPLAAQLDDLREASARLDGAFGAQSEEAWRRTVELRNGVRDTASALPFRRWIEIELHHVDLGTGHGIEDLPGAFVERELGTMARRFAGHPDITTAVELRSEDGNTWRTGAESGEPVVVTGGPAQLVGWLTGRTTGSGLSSSAPLPELPAL